MGNKRNKIPPKKRSKATFLKIKQAYYERTGEDMHEAGIRKRLEKAAEKGRIDVLRRAHATAIQQRDEARAQFVEADAARRVAEETIASMLRDAAHAAWGRRSSESTTSGTAAAGTPCTTSIVAGAAGILVAGPAGTLVAGPARTRTARTAAIGSTAGAATTAATTRTSRTALSASTGRTTASTSTAGTAGAARTAGLAGAARATRTARTAGIAGTTGTAAAGTGTRESRRSSKVELTPNLGQALECQAGAVVASVVREAATSARSSERTAAAAGVTIVDQNNHHVSSC